MIKRLFRLLDKRLELSPLLGALKQSRPANYISPMDTPPISPGHIALLLITALVLSGLGMTFFYSPTTEEAASSLAYLHQEQPLGWLLHNIHRWSALLPVAFVILHALRVWLTRAYRFPRDLNWWLGLCLLLLVFVMGGTGYLLRWDIKAFALMDLVISNFSSLPIVGPLLITILLGGSQPDIVPLYRGYALHAWFLPMLLFFWLGSIFLLFGSKGLWKFPQSGEDCRKCFPRAGGSTCCPAWFCSLCL